MRLRLSAFGPAVPRPRWGESLRAGLGAGLALVLAGLVLRLGPHEGAMALIPPLGATAFLMFFVPSSPLAQPWPALVGNVVAALAAMAVVAVLPPSPLAAALAVALAMVAMAALRAPHPPAGAVALFAALLPGDPGPLFPLHPVADGTLILIACAILWNRLTGRSYPFRQPPPQGPHGTADAAAQRRLGLSPQDLAALLSRLRLDPNLGPEDLARLLEAAEAEAVARHPGHLTAADILSRDVVFVAPETPAAEAAALILRHGFNSLPVRRADGSVAGLIMDRDLIAAPPGQTAATLARPVVTLPRDAGLSALLPLLADSRQPSVPITEDGRLCGIVTRSDLLALLSHMVLHGPSP